MNSKSKRNLIKLLITSFSSSLLISLTNTVSAATAPPACPASGSVAALPVNAMCLSTPEKFEITIHEIGISPDIEVESIWDTENQSDNQLEYALNLLSE